MPIFSYKARNSRGRLIEGVVDAVTADAVANLLVEKNLVVTNIERQGGEFLKSHGLFFFRRVKNKELVFFFRQLAVMIEANLPIVRALKILVRQTGDKKLKRIIATVADEVDGGSKLSEAMASFPEVFGVFYINMIGSGETSGRLSEVVNYLADQQEKDYDLQSRVKGALIYPAFIIVSLLVVAFIIMTFVIPQISSLLKESNVTLPLTTRILMAVSDWLRAWWWQAIIAIILLIGGLSVYGRSETGGHFFDWLKLRVPIFGKIFREIYIVRITRSLNTLLAGGVPVARALEVVKEVVGNKIYKEILEQAIKEVEEGNPLADSLLVFESYLPLAVSQMVSIGEETGKLEEVTGKIADFYSREVDASTRNLTVLIEPVVMIILGVGIAFFIMAVITPMWQLSASM
ncbi:MAG: type II secretion system F family protein [Patescibacteria group bacterium]